MKIQIGVAKNEKFEPILENCLICRTYGWIFTIYIIVYSLQTERPAVRDRINEKYICWQATRTYMHVYAYMTHCTIVCIKWGTTWITLFTSASAFNSLPTKDGNYRTCTIVSTLKCRIIHYFMAVKGLAEQQREQCQIIFESSQSDTVAMAKLYLYIVGKKTGDKVNINTPAPVIDKYRAISPVACSLLFGPVRV